MPKEFEQVSWDAVLTEDECRRIVRAAVLEDLDRGQDWTTLAIVPMETAGRAEIVARQAGVIAGLPAARIVVEEMDRKVEFAALVNDGSAVEPGQTIASLQGPARSLLTIERPLLNFLGRLSGIATQTRRFVEAVSGAQSAPV